MLLCVRWSALDGTGGESSLVANVLGAGEFVKKDEEKTRQECGRGVGLGVGLGLGLGLRFIVEFTLLHPISLDLTWLDFTCLLDQ